MSEETVVKVLYFARVAELTGVRSEALALAQALPAAQWLADLVRLYPQLAPASRLRLAINQHHARPDALVRPGDELAVFDPVTGG